MWSETIAEQDAREFMESVYYFHDSCIKEMHYSIAMDCLSA